MKSHHSSTTRRRGKRTHPTARRRLRPGDLPGLMRRTYSRSTAPRVLLAGKLTALDAPGGGEIQLLAMVKHLPEVGVNARLWRPWEDRLQDSDMIHVFGSLREHVPTVLAARARGVRVVVSPIAWYELASYWREPTGLPRRLAACGNHLMRSAFPGVGSWRRTLYHAADLLLPNSHAEAQQLVRCFGVPADRIRVVPNGAEEGFANADPTPFAKLVGERRFVLCCGRIEPRKNQLAVIRALDEADIPLVILGDPVPGHEHYYGACREAAGRHVRFVPRLDPHDPLLSSAYAAAACVVLASWYETPGLVALEAGMSGVPLVVPDCGATREYFAGHAKYINGGDLPGIRRAVQGALLSPRDPALAEHIRRNFTWRIAAQLTCQTYRGLSK